MKTPQSVDNRETVLLVGVSLKKAPRGRAGDPSAAGRDSLEELHELAESAGAKIAGSILQVREQLDPATLVGRGKLAEIRAEAELRHVPLVIVDHNLTPVQLRNMEKGIGTRVIDRTQLILDIFAMHARTREGQLQGELAQLNYLLPRLTGRGQELSRLRALRSDTVGFLRDLPPDLIAAFRATLEEVQEAALIVQVSDISNPNHASQDADVMKVLTDLGVQDRPRLQVFNKTDLLSAEDLATLLKANGRSANKIFTSAVTGYGLEDLLARMDAELPIDPLVHLHLRIPISDGRHLSLVHASGTVLDSKVLDNHMYLEADLPESLARRLEDFVIPASALPTTPTQSKEAKI